MPITSDVNIPLDNKQLRFYDATGKYTRVSVDEAIAREYNKWQDWYCSAGDRNLYIDYDGNVWVANCASAASCATRDKTKWNVFINKHNPELLEDWATFREKHIGPYPHAEWVAKNTEGGWPMPKTNWENCEQNIKLMAYIKELEKQFDFFETQSNNSLYKKFLKQEGFNWFSTVRDIKEHWGLLGNIIDGWVANDNWIVCPYESCGCGADVILSKVKDNSAVKHMTVTQYGYEGQHNTAKNYTEQLIHDPVGVEMNFPIHYQILWDLTRRCNYDCTYCWPSVHNKTDTYLKWPVIEKALDDAIDWADGEEIRWNFGGGEPTLHPEFMNIIKYLKDRGQWILVTSNGSRSTKFWKEAVQYLNSINMSAHFGSMDLFANNEDRFINNCKTIMEYHNKVDDDFWIEIKLMTPPGYLDRAQNFRDRILDLQLLDRPGANNRMKGIMSLVPIRDITDSSSLVDYNEKEIEFFRNQ